MPCDALSYKFIATELNNALSSGRIEKVNMPEPDELFLQIRANRQTSCLVVSAGLYPRVHLTKAQKENPASPPAFCMNLRKNINGGVIKGIRAEEDERVLFINISFRTELGIKEDKTLICEIMGKYSNIILIDENDKIIESLKHIPLDVSIKRQILPGLKYAAPTQEKLSPLDYEGIKNLKLTGDIYQDILKNVKGLAPSTIAEAVFRASKDSAESVAAALNEVCSLPIKPCVFLSKSEGEKSDFFIRPYESLEGEYLFFESLSEAMDYYYTARDTKSRLNAKSKTYLTIAKNALKRAEKRLADFYMRLNESEKCEVDRIKGELITANIYRIKAGTTVLNAENYYENNAEILIQLDPTLSPAQNAQRYFKRYAKAKRTAVAAKEQAAKTELDKAAIEEVITSISEINSARELSDIADEMAQVGLIKPIKRGKSEKMSEPIKTVVDGFTILIGKNNIQNDRLLKAAKRNDIWLHTRLSHGSHVYIDTSSFSVNDENEKYELSISGLKVPDKVILTAARYAAYYSKAKDSDKTEVDYTLARYVSKPASSSPGRVIYTNQKTIVVTPLELK